MSLHGLKKAVARLPQQFATSTSEVPAPLKQLEKLLDAGEKAIDVLISQSKAYSDNVTGILDSSVGLLLGYEKDTQKLSELRIEILKASEANQHRVHKPCLNMKQQLANVRKVIAKRNRKKLDCDRHTSSLQKHENTDAVIKASPNHQKKGADISGELQTSVNEYNAQNALLDDKLPKTITILQNFLRDILQQEYNFQITTMKRLQDFYEPLAAQLKIPVSAEALQSSSIISSWKSPYLECKQAVEDGIEIVKMSKVPTMSMSQTAIKTQLPAVKPQSEGPYALAPVGKPDTGSTGSKLRSGMSDDHKPALPTRSQEHSPARPVTDADAPPPAYDSPPGPSVSPSSGSAR